MSSLRRDAIAYIGKLLQPHLTKAIGYQAKPLPDWRADPAFTVSPRSFTSTTSETTMKRHDLISNLVDMRRPYKILCLDGGGVRGSLTATILKRIIEHHPNFMEHVDFICGTSAGGILALLVASGYTPRECQSIFSSAAPHIFTHNPWRVINPLRAKYSDKKKEEIFKEYFGERTMSDAEKTCAVVAFRLDGRKSSTHTFFNKEGWRPAVFSNMPRAAGRVEPDSDLKLWDAAMRTSAAPTYFPVFRGYTDGGIVANNPSVIAVTKAMAHFPYVTARNVVVLSIGAGNFPRHANIFDGGLHSQVRVDEFGGPELWRADWGIRQWMPFLLDLLLDGDTVTIDMIMHYLLGGSHLYHRIDPRLPRKITLDDVASIQELTSFGESLDLTQTLTFIKENFTGDGLTSESMVTNALDSASSYSTAWEKYV